MSWNSNTIERFTQIVGIDFNQLMNDFIDFNDNLKQKIYDYYSGEVKRADGEAFKELDRLREDVRSSIVALRINRESFFLYEDWELFLDLEDMDSQLSTIYNSSKFLRSGISRGNFNAQPLVEITLGNNQTLENLASSLNSTDPQNEWTRIFLNNQLTEEDYSGDEGTLLKVTFQGANPLFLNSVIDNVDVAKKIYGKDLKAKLIFDANESDLKVLTYKETLIQTIDILSRLTRGSVPETPDQGIQSNLLVGSTIGSLTFPALFRQLYQNFATDDSFKSFALTDLEVIGDALQISYQLTTRADEVESGTLII